MKKINRWLPILILSLGLLFRFWKMEYLPFQNDSDELAHVFAGQSLWEGKGPISWSSFYYEGPLVHSSATLGEKDKASLYFIFIKPWFDHPPLLALIQGGLAKLTGFDFPSMPPSLLFRLPTLVFSGFTLGLVFLLSRHWFGFYPALFSLSLLAFSPVLILGQRMAVGENLFIPLNLAVVYLMVSAKNLTGKRLAIMVFLTVLSGLTKVTGLAVMALVAGYLLMKNYWRGLIIYLTASLGLFALVYGLYGYFIDWSQFMIMFKLQSHRFIGLANPVNLLAKPWLISFKGLLPEFWHDFSYYAILLLAFGGLWLGKGISWRFTNLTVFISWLSIWLTASEFSDLNWHKLPLFIWLTIAAAGVIKAKKYWLTSVLMVMTVINNWGLVRNIEHPRPDGLYIRLVVGLIFAGLFWWLLKGKLASRLAAATLVLVMAVYALSAGVVIDGYYDAACRDQVCPLPQITTTGIIKNKLLP